jgi:dihydrodipicolinate synthase/N-acetylneuraminate lyase
MPARQPISMIDRVRQGLCMPAHPLALDAAGRLDEQRQTALTSYYLDAGVGGIAVGVHTTQFEIRDAGLLRPVLDLAATRVREADNPVALIAGVCGPTAQAVEEAVLARELGYDIALVSLAGLDGGDRRLVEHVARVGDVLPVMGFYLQGAAGGQRLRYDFWRTIAELQSVVAIKIAPFDRYATLDVVRAVGDSDRADEVALYTGNDDHILLDLLTVFRTTRPDGRSVEQRVVGALLGQNAVWTHRAVELFHAAGQARDGASIDVSWLTLANELTDANSALFDPAGGFAGCIAGIHEVLRRQGFLDEVRLLDPRARVSNHQMAQIDRVLAAYPHLTDDEFVSTNLDRWLGRAPLAAKQPRRLA